MISAHDSEETPKGETMKVAFAQPQFVAEGKVYKFQSESREDVEHYVIVGTHGAICTCEGWRFRRNCKHVERVPYEAPPEEFVARRTNKETGGEDDPTVGSNTA